MSRQERRARSEYLRNMKLMNAMLDEKMLEMLKWCNGSGQIEKVPGTLYQLTEQEQGTLVAVKAKESLDKLPDEGDPPDHPSNRIDKLLGHAKSILSEDDQFGQAYKAVRSIMLDHNEFTYYKADLVKLIDLEKKLREFSFSLEDSALYDILTVRKMLQSYPLCSRFLGLRAVQGELVKPTRDMRNALESLELLEPDNPGSVERAISNLRCCHYPIKRIVTGLRHKDVSVAMLAPLIVRLLDAEGKGEGVINKTLSDSCGEGYRGSLLYGCVEDNWKNLLLTDLKHYIAQRSQGPQHKGYKDRKFEWEVRIGCSRDEKVAAVGVLCQMLEEPDGNNELSLEDMKIIMQPRSATRQIMMKHLPSQLKRCGGRVVTAEVIGLFNAALSPRHGSAAAPATKSPSAKD